MIENTALVKFTSITAVWVLFVVISAPLAAQSDCQQIVADIERLACYDLRYPPQRTPSVPESVEQDKPATELTRQPTPGSPIEADAVLTEQPASDAVKVVEAETPAEERFGRESIKAKKNLDNIQSVISAVIKQPRGHRQFTLENGQVWREVEVGRSQFRKGAAIKIVRTAFGSYQLKGSNGRRTKVRRVN